MNKIIEDNSINLGNLNLESHVEVALYGARAFAGDDPVNAGHIIKSIIYLVKKENFGNSTAFSKLTELFSSLDISYKIQFSESDKNDNIVKLSSSLVESFNIAEEFIAGKRIWGRDLITIVLLAKSDPSLVQIVSEMNLNIAAIQSEWFQFVMSGSYNHRPWQLWQIAAEVIKLYKPISEVYDTYLLTWNPDRFEFDKIEEKVNEVRDKGFTEFDWSLGNRRNVKIGDHVYFMKQGTGQRGLIGAGKIIGDPIEDEHYEYEKAEKGGKFWRVPIKWEALSVEPILKIDTLINEIGKKELWETRAGGVTIAPEIVTEIEELWPQDLMANDTVPIHNDFPAIIDELNRKPFARIISDRIIEIRNNFKQAFSVHIHGPWGSGKSTLLEFIKDQLSSEKWIIINFNAWRHKNTDPPWWPLIRQVYKESLEQIEKFQGFKRITLKFRWFFWRLKADWLPFFIALIVVGLILYVIIKYFDLSEFTSDIKGPIPGDQIEFVLKGLTALFAVWATIIAVSRTLLFGSSRAAKTFLELSSNPFKPISKLFKNLVKTIDRPVAILIDDLDRCSNDYVVNLLEGIQTLFKEVKVTYVVAADRDWIRVSFEERYEKFKEIIKEPGRPLGFLFLEKMFQVSAPVPKITPQKLSEYWVRLLKTNNPINPEEIEKTIKKAEEVGDKMIGDEYSEDVLKNIIDEYEGNEAVKQGLRVAAARRLTDKKGLKEIEHRLKPYAELLEPNPRWLKRLVNAYSLKQPLNIIEGKNIGTEPLILWTIIELRWPILADYFNSQPEVIFTILKNESLDDFTISEEIRQLLEDKTVNKIIHYPKPDADPSLTENKIRDILSLNNN